MTAALLNIDVHPIPFGIDLGISPVRQVVSIENLDRFALLKRYSLLVIVTRACNEAKKKQCQTDMRNGAAGITRISLEHRISDHDIHKERERCRENEYDHGKLVKPKEIRHTGKQDADNSRINHALEELFRAGILPPQ